MTPPCPPPEAWSTLLDPEGEPLPTDLLAHVDVCPACAGEVSDLLRVRSEALPSGLRARALARVRPRRWTYWGAAAALLLCVSWILLREKPREPGAIRAPAARVQASLELAPGGDASLSGGILTLRAGACWLDTKVPVDLPEFSVRFEAGTEAEVRLLPAPKAAWSLLGEALAEGPRAALVSVVSGGATAGTRRIPAGMRIRFPSGALEPLDAASIDAWRSARLEGGSRGPERTLTTASFAPEARAFSVEVRDVTGYLELRYPAGQTTLGRLEAWKDGAWHRISVTWRGSGTEVFLDGRRILKLPGAEGSGIPGIEVRGGSLILREIRH